MPYELDPYPLVAVIIHKNDYDIPVGTLVTAQKDGLWNAYFVKSHDYSWSNGYIFANGLELLGRL